MTNTPLSSNFQFSLLTFNPFLIQSLDSVQVFYVPWMLLQLYLFPNTFFFQFVLSKNIVFPYTYFILNLFSLSKDG